MLDSLEIRNFQSLQKIDLELAPLTVIVGPSSSGKSALVRALSTLFSNRRGTDFISHGTSTSVITSRSPEGTVSLSRSTTAAKNMYTLITPDGETEKFTKLGGDTPPEVSRFLKIPSKDPITLAGQFDKPFLLADSPAQAAQTLGALTNVHVIFEAAREANRLRLNASQTFKTKTTDLESITTRLEGFEGVEDEQEALEAAETALDAARAAQRRLSALQGHIDTLSSTKAAIAQAKVEADRSVPSVEGIEAAHSRVLTFTETIRSLKEANAAVKSQTQLLESLSAETDELEKEYTTVLHAMGTCPTCGQEITSE